MFDNIRQLCKRSDAYIPMPEGFDPEIFREVMERSNSPEQQTRVLRTAYHLTRLWPFGKSVFIPRIVVSDMVTYPHLERMAELELFTSEWLAELTTALQLAAHSAEVLANQPADLRQLLHEALDNFRDD